MKKPKKPRPGVNRPQRREKKEKPSGVNRPLRKVAAAAKGTAKAPPVKETVRKRIPAGLAAAIRAHNAAMRTNQPVFSFAPAMPLPSVVPKDRKPLAFDSQLDVSMAYAASTVGGGAFEQGLTFLGYAYLSELAQRPENRRISEVISTEMTRRWIEFKSVGDEDEPDEDVLAGKEVLRSQKQEQKEQQIKQLQQLTTDEVVRTKDDRNRTDPDPNADPNAAEGEEPTDPDEEAVLNDPALEEGQEPELEEGAIPGQEEGEAPMTALGAKPPGEEDDNREELDEEGQPKDDKAERIQELEDAMKLLDVREVFRKLALQDGFFGRSHLYIDTGDTDMREELRLAIGDGRDKMSQAKVSPQKPVLRLAVVEPIWCYPSNYNSNDPLRADWYKPDMWFVQGKELHASRLLTFVGREVPDLVKPAFAFGGLSLTQMCKPAVDNWLRVRSAVSRLVWSFSVSGLATKMEEGLTPQGEELMNRVDLFDAFRDNQGTMVIDKETEEFFNVSTPLGTLDTLQAQAQEHMASVCGIPLVKLLGIQPAGLNASSEGEIRTFYDWINAYQEHFFRPHLTRVINFIMLSLWGEIDEDIVFDFAPLWSLDEKALAEVQKTKMDTATGYVSASILDPVEVRKNIADDPDSGFNSIDVSDVPEAELPPMAPGMNADPDAEGGGTEPGSQADTDAEGGGGINAPSPKPPSSKPPAVSNTKPEKSGASVKK